MGCSSPQLMMERVFYWIPCSTTPRRPWNCQRIDLCLCIAALAAAFILKRHRKPILFLTAVYLGNLYIYR